MNLVDFNNNFSGFKKNEDIMIDTNILLALLNEYNYWHLTVKNLFDNFIFSSDSNITLYIHSGIVNEVMNLSFNPLKDYISAYPLEQITQQMILNTKKKIQQGTREFIELELLTLLPSNKPSLLRQIDYSEYFGAMDSLIVSLIEEYGISLLSTDSKLKNNIANKASEFKNIENLYYTAPRNKSY